MCVCISHPVLKSNIQMHKNNKNKKIKTGKLSWTKGEFNISISKHTRKVTQIHSIPEMYVCNHSWWQPFLKLAERIGCKHRTNGLSLWRTCNGQTVNNQLQNKRNFIVCSTRVKDRADLLLTEIIYVFNPWARI